MPMTTRVRVETCTHPHNARYQCCRPCRIEANRLQAQQEYARRAARKCSIEECDRRLFARGWCQRHYENWKLRGDPMPMSRTLSPEFRASIQRARAVSPKPALTHCKRGHVMTEENTYVHPNRAIRECVTCKRIRGQVVTTKHYRAVIVRPLIRRAIMERDNWTCAYGGCRATTLDHVVPKAERRRHGIDDSDATYIVAACFNHNVAKMTYKVYPRGFDKSILPGNGWREWDGTPEGLRVPATFDGTAEDLRTVVK